MDFYQSLKQEVLLLDRRGIIDITWLQRWIILLVVTFASILCLWDWFVAESDPNMHFPPSLIPPELRRKLPPQGFANEREERAFATREIEFAIVGCVDKGGNPEKTAIDAAVMMKSAAMLSKAIIHFHIFTDDAVYLFFMAELDRWPPHVRHRVSFKFHPVSFPEYLLDKGSMHTPCSTLKLFIPRVLRDLDYAIYVENDALFLNPVEDLWANLMEYNDTHVASLPMTDIYPGPWQIGRSSHPTCAAMPHYGTRGLNSGIVLYDIHRLRHTVFEIPVTRRKDCANCETFRDMYEVQNMTWNTNMIHTVYNLFRDVITVPDQDIFDIIFYFNPDKLYPIPCSWNFRWRFCEAKIQEAKTKFLKAIWNSKFPAPKGSICPAAFLIHRHSSVTDQMTHGEFVSMKELWHNASYGTPKSDVLLGVNKILKEIENNTEDPGSQRSECARMNTQLFLRSLEMCPKDEQ